MLSMAKINDIKYLKQVQGLSYRKVKTLTGHSYACFLQGQIPCF